MKPAVKAAYRAAMSDARSARARGELTAAFAALERAHILGQRYLLPHIVTHLHMLRIGFSRRDLREVIGQIVRLLATVPGYVTGWVPKGNPGGANVSALKPMPLSGEFAVLLEDFRVGRDVLGRAVLYIATVLVVIAGLFAAEWRRGADAAALEEAWRNRAVHAVAEFGTTDFLEVTPIVNWRAPVNLKAEPGVSYLIRTDTSTVLFDLGYNRNRESPSPVEHNLAALDVQVEDLDGLFLSHGHRDHVGGVQWEREGSFSFGLEQARLPARLAVLASRPTTYPGHQVEVAEHARAWLPGFASTGPIPRRLLLGRIDEQALVINVAGLGLVVIVGCGHQTVPKLHAHIGETFSEPLIGVVGDLHYPVPQGRLFVAGIDAQRLLASGEGWWNPIGRSQVEEELESLAAQLKFAALGSHDTSDEVLELAAERFGPRLLPVVAGQPFCVRAGADGNADVRAGRCS